MSLLDYKKKIQNGTFNLERTLKNEYEIPGYVINMHTQEDLQFLVDTIPNNPWVCYNKDKLFNIDLCKKLAIKYKIDLPIEKAKAYTLWALDKISENGHTVAQRWQIDTQLSDIINKILIDQSIDILYLNKNIFISKNKKYITLSKYYYAENKISSKLYNLNRLNNQETIFKSYSDISLKYSILNKEQKDVVDSVENNKLIILTGLPGTGKTTTIQAIIESYCHSSLYLFAPTGKAAARITEMTGVEARTLHSTFGVGEVYSHSIIIVDEVSMCDVEIGQMLAEGVDESCTLILVGDPDQLPSVGPGQFLKDILDSGIGNRHHLTKVMRQKPGSLLQSAHAIHDGKPLVVSQDKQVNIFSPKEWNISNIISKIVDHPEWRDAQFLSVLREKGSSIANPIIRNVINPGIESRWRIDDKVIHTKNNKELGVSNGEMGTIIGVTNNSVTVDYNTKIVYYPSEYLIQLDHAYCMTVHKSQGSEFDKVVFILNRSRITTRNILYTALTRAKQKVLIVCENPNDVIETINRLQEPRQTNLLNMLNSKIKGDLYGS